MKTTLAVDAGGTSSRAALLDADGRCLGSARAGGGNPTSSGVEAASAEIARAAAQSIAQARVHHPGLTIAPGSTVAITQAGQVSDAYRAALHARLSPLGFDRIVIESDLLGMFGSGSASRDGIVLVAGTGSVAGRIVGGAVVQEVGGTGWLLGDGGSGFWIGRRILRAVTADLDGLGPETLLTGLLSDALQLPRGSGTSIDGARLPRSATLDSLIRAVNDGPPISIARFAPLAFAATGDPVAVDILDHAVERLEALVRSVRRPAPGPADATLVVGGSVLVDGILPTLPDASSRLSNAAGGAVLVPVSDGLVGAAALGISSIGGRVDDALHARISAALARTTRQATT